MATDVVGAIRMLGTVPQLFPSLGPALMICMDYIDLGKWVAAVEGGARFGLDLVPLVLFFNCTAIFCQYLATRIGVVTGKNLAQICSEEYCSLACILLGVQAELSVIASDLSIILGIAQGFNLLFGMDLFTSIFLAAITAVLLPLLVTLLDNCKAEVLYISIAGFTLLFYVIGVLISQPEIPPVINGIFPRLSGDSAYSLMALLGANIMAHNFYIHSSIVQQQKRPPNVAVGALFHNHFFAILFVFSGIFLVNYVLMSSAASIFDSAGLVGFAFQDASLLMDQIFRSPIPPVAFLLVVSFSSLITALTHNLGVQVVLHDFFGIEVSAWVHHALMKVLAVILALYCAQSAGGEGIYQLLIFCQVILAMILPPSTIPLFRVASSNLIMGAFKISYCMEFLAFFAFSGMLASNIIFIIEMLFGNSSWTVGLRGSMGSSLTLPFSALLLIACSSLSLTLYLAVTPLKSASDGPDIHMSTWHLQKDQPKPTEDGEENDLKEGYEGRESATEPAEPAFEKSAESQSANSVKFNLSLPETPIDSYHDLHQFTPGLNLSADCTSAFHLEGSNSEVELGTLETVDKVSVGDMLGASILKGIELKERVRRNEKVATNAHTVKEDVEGDALELEESSRVALLPSTCEDPGSSEDSGVKGDDVGNGSGSLSRLSGLGRATRRQFAAILDEFWGHLFDFHGQLTQEATTKRVDILLGLDLKSVGSSVKANTGNESSKKYFPESERGLNFPTNSRNYISLKQQRIPSNSPYGTQIGSPSWSPKMQLSDMHGRNSWFNVLEPGEKNSSSLHLPEYSDNWDYQPATIHGYQVPSYLRGLGVGRHSDFSSLLDVPPTTKSAESFLPNYRDPLTHSLGQNRLDSLCISGFQKPPVSRINWAQFERPYCESSLVGTSENVVSSTYTKKYHSLPDISGLTVSSRSSCLNDRNALFGGPIGPRSSIGKMAHEQSQSSSTEGISLAFDELSPSKLYSDVLFLQSNPDTKSLWSRQPFEQLFGVTSKAQNEGNSGVTNRTSVAPTETFSYSESTTKFLHSFRFCITKLLKLEGSDWLFRQNGGADEEVIDQVAAKERFLHEVDASEVNQGCLDEPQYSCSGQKGNAERFPIPNCGDGCIWQAGLIVTFGVWCIHRILELSLVESRPELWGKYTYVLNRLQGILEPAFSKPRSPISHCPCLEIPAAHRTRSSLPLQNGLGKPCSGRCTTSITVLEIIKDVEVAISGRKGRMGTAAGDVAFPKGKENLASVLKRYKRRLSNK